MAKIIHILPHNIEDYMSGTYHNFDHHSVRFLIRVQYFWLQLNQNEALQQELWVISKKISQVQIIQHEKGFLVRLFPKSGNLPFPLEFSWSLLKAVFKSKAQGTQLYHLHSYYLWLNDFIGLILKIKKQKFLIHFRGGGFSQSRQGFFYSLYHYLFGLRFSVGLAQKVFVQNHDEINRLKRWFLAQKENIIFFPNSIPRVIVADSTKTTQQFFDNEWLLLIAGRTEKITQRENNLIILEKILGRCPKCHLEIAGLKKINPALERLRTKLKSQVVLTPWLNKIMLLEKFQQADLLLYLTEKEGSPMGLIEALSQGLPAISLDVEGVRDVIKNDFNGWLLQDIEGLPQLLEKIIKNPAQLPEIRKNAIATIKENFTDEIHFPKIISIYQQLFKIKP